MLGTLLSILLVTGLYSDISMPIYESLSAKPEVYRNYTKIC